MPTSCLKIGHGFAEYWSADLLQTTKDRLVVFDNAEQLRVGILRTTLSHEVSGHGVFYESASRCAPPFFDHGAMSFIEGWAAWCEWHGSASPFGAIARKERLAGLRWFYETDVERICRGVPQDIRAFGYSEDTARSSLLYYFQYPGFSMAYALGALWFEDRFQHSPPMEFLGAIGARPWGDFFRGW